MAVTRTIHQSYGSRIGNSFKGMLAGLVLFIGGIVLLFWNEGRTVHRAKALAEGEKNCEEVNDVAAPDSAQEGRLVHFSGMTQSEETLSDEAFGIAVPGIRLLRSAEMFQWVEHEKKTTKENIGGSTDTEITYSYSKEWSRTLENSREFAEPEGHTNPSAMPFESRSWQVSEASIGGFHLGPTVVSRIRGETPYEFPADYTPPESLAGRAFVRDGGIYVPAKTPAAAPAAAPAKQEVTEAPETPETPVPAASASAEPEVGDVRLSFSWVPHHVVSIIGQQSGNGIKPYAAKTGTLLEVRDGEKTAGEMFEAAKSENRMVAWLLRIVGFLVLFLGVKAFLGPLEALSAVLPFLRKIVGVASGLVAAIVAIPVGLVTVAIAWLAYRPVLGISLLVLAVVSIVYFRRRIAASRAAA